MSEPLAVSITEAARMAGIGRTSLYEEIGRGALPARKIGRRTVVRIDDLREWLDKLPTQSAAQAA